MDAKQVCKWAGSLLSRIHLLEYQQVHYLLHFSGYLIGAGHGKHPLQ